MIDGSFETNILKGEFLCYIELILQRVGYLYLFAGALLKGERLNVFIVTG